MPFQSIKMVVSRRTPPKQFVLIKKKKCKLTLFKHCFCCCFCEWLQFQLVAVGQPDLNFIVGIVLGEFVEWPRVDKESCRRVTASMPVPSKRRCRGSLLLSVMETQKSTMSPLFLLLTIQSHKINYLIIYLLIFFIKTSDSNSNPIQMFLVQVTLLIIL